MSKPDCLLAKAANAKDSIELYQALKDAGDVHATGINTYAGKCGDCVLRLAMKAPPGQITTPAEKVEVVIALHEECVDPNAHLYLEQINEKYQKVTV